MEREEAESVTNEERNDFDSLPAFITEANRLWAEEENDRLAAELLAALATERNVKRPTLASGTFFSRGYGVKVDSHTFAEVVSIRNALLCLACIVT